MRTRPINAPSTPVRVLLRSHRTCRMETVAAWWKTNGVTAGKWPRIWASAKSRGYAMMHTVKVIAGGLVLLAVCLLIGRWLGGATPAVGLVKAVKGFVPLWQIGRASCRERV